MTFYELYEIWKSTKSLYVKRSTISAYELSLRKRILPALGAMDIGDIKTHTLQAFLNELISSGLSIKSTQDTMIVVKMILRHGADMDLMPYRKFNLKYPSRSIDETKAIEIYTTEEQKKIVQYVISNPAPRNLGILIALITGIKCERLQDISDEDCFREGISESWYESTDTTTYGYADEKKGTAVEFDTPRKAFAALIDKVSGRGTWASNPWVVVYEFELVK